MSLNSLFAVAIYYNRAMLHRYLGNTTEAVKDISCALEMAPEIANLYVMRGNQLKKLQRYKEAMSDFNSALHIDADVKM